MRIRLRLTTARKVIYWIVAVVGAILAWTGWTGPQLLNHIAAVPWLSFFGSDWFRTALLIVGVALIAGVTILGFRSSVATIETVTIPVSKIAAATGTVASPLGGSIGLRGDLGLRFMPGPDNLAGSHFVQWKTANRSSHHVGTGQRIQALRFVFPMTGIVRPADLPVEFSCGAGKLIVKRFTDSGFAIEEANTDGVEVRAEAYHAAPDIAELRLSVKSLLGAADQSGHKLHADKDVRAEEAERWVTGSHDLVTEAFGSGEGRLFLSDASYTFYAGSDSKQRLWIEGRLRRLAELQARADTLTIRPEFDPTKWSTP